MPTIFVWKGFRFFFYSNEGTKPPHVHIRSQDREVKIWLADLSSLEIEASRIRI